MLNFLKNLFKSKPKFSALERYQNSIINLAARKIGRPLSDLEKQGIRSIKSFMMLEAVEAEIMWVEISAATVEKSLAYWITQIR